MTVSNSVFIDRHVLNRRPQYIYWSMKLRQTKAFRKCSMQQTDTQCNKLLPNAMRCYRMQQTDTQCNTMLPNETTCYPMQQTATQYNKMIRKNQHATQCNKLLPNTIKWYGKINMPPNATNCYPMQHSAGNIIPRVTNVEAKATNMQHRPVIIVIRRTKGVFNFVTSVT